MLHQLEGPELRGHYWEDREVKKAQQPTGGIQTHDLSVTRHVLYRSATTTAQTILKVEEYDNNLALISMTLSSLGAGVVAHWLERQLADLKNVSHGIESPQVLGFSISRSILSSH